MTADTSYLYPMIVAFAPVHAIISLTSSEPYECPDDIDLADRYEHPLQKQANQLLDEAVSKGVTERQIIWQLAMFLADQIEATQLDPVDYADRMKALMAARYEG